MNDKAARRIFHFPTIQGVVFVLVLTAGLLWLIRQLNTAAGASGLLRSVIFSVFGLLISVCFSQALQIKQLRRELAAKEAELALRGQWQKNH